MFDMKLITQHNIECLPDPSQQRSRWQQAQTGLLQCNHKNSKLVYVWVIV
jgi:hypothetical protein